MYIWKRENNLFPFIVRLSTMYFEQNIHSKTTAGHISKYNKHYFTYCKMTLHVNFKNHMLYIKFLDSKNPCFPNNVNSKTEGFS